MRKFTFFSISIFILIMLFQADALACKCAVDPGQTLEQKINANLKTAKAVFSGEVIEISDSAGGQYVVVKMKVEESWKGTLPEEIYIATAKTTCDYRFEKGKSYLIFAQSSEKYELITASCLSNKKLENAAEELKILGAGKKDKLVCPTIRLREQIEGLPKDTWIYTVLVENAASNAKLTYKWEYWIGDKKSEIKSGENHHTDYD